MYEQLPSIGSSKQPFAYIPQYCTLLLFTDSSAFIHPDGKITLEAL